MRITTVCSIRRGRTKYNQILHPLIDTGYRLNVLALPLLLSDYIHGVVEGSNSPNVDPTLVWTQITVSKLGSVIPKLDIDYFLGLLVFWKTFRRLPSRACRLM